MRRMKKISGLPHRPNVPGSLKRKRASASVRVEPTKEILAELGGGFEYADSGNIKPLFENPTEIEPCVAAPEVEVPAAPSKPKLIYTEPMLARMKMNELRKLGRKFGVTANTKDRLVALILKAQ